ncbi:MAG: flavin reductase family protein [Proteobacteria bacterium]|nr:flavin reductase family protein [Pseudomonadota bacterium]
MFYEPRKKNHSLPHDPFKALVGPRPIGWISTLSKEGVPNLSPYSFFNAFSDHPAILGFSSWGWKDSANNARDTGEFVVNVVMKSDLDRMNQSSAPYPSEVNEFEAAGIGMVPSTFVKPPRVEGVGAAFECKVTQIIPMTGHDGREAAYHLVLGEAVGIYIDDRFITDGKVDEAGMQLLARLGYMNYAAVENVFSLKRPTI